MKHTTKRNETNSSEPKLRLQLHHSCINSVRSTYIVHLLLLFFLSITFYFILSFFHTHKIQYKYTIQYNKKSSTMFTIWIIR